MARRRRARIWGMGPPQAGSISESGLYCQCVRSWQERSDWLVFLCVAGRSGATGLYLGGQLAGAERLDVFSLFNSYF